MEGKMTRRNCEWLSLGLFTLAIVLPLYLLQYRTQHLHCEVDIDYEHCATGVPYTRVLGFGLIDRPSIVPYAVPPIWAFDVPGIYARRGYSAATAEIGGLAIPLFLCVVSGYLARRAMKR